MGKSVDYPEPPNPYQTAQVQGEINRDAAIDQTRLNAMDQYTPFGSLTYQEQPGATVRQFDQEAYDIALADWKNRTEKASPGGWVEVWDPGQKDYVRTWQEGSDAPPRPDRNSFYYDEEGVPRFTATQTLSPEQQALYDRSVGIQGDLLNIGQSQLDRVSYAMSRPMSMANLPALQVPLRGVGQVGQTANIGGPDQNRASIGGAGNIQRGFADGGQIQQSVGADDFGADRQRVEDALVARMQPYLDRRREAQRTSLVNQGFSDTASEGYTSAMDEVNRQENDALLAAIAQAGQEQSRLFGIDLAAGQFANQAVAQQYAQNAGQAQFANQAQAQAFQQAGARAAFDNANADTIYQQQLAQQAANNQAQGQRFAQEVTRANADQARAAAINAARQQALQERVMQRQMPINELSAFLSQSQLQAPQFVNTPQTSVAAPNYQDAAFAAYNGQMAQAQAQAQQNAAVTQGLFALGGAGLGAFGAINPFGWGAAPAA